MGVKIRTEGKSQRVRRYKQAFVLVGGFLAFFGFIASIVSLFVKPGLFLSVVLLLQFILDTGIFLFAYGLALAQGRRWHIFGLLNFVFFGSFVLGLFSMVGRETTIGYYIWAIGGAASLAIIVILVAYWDKLLDG